MSEGFNYLKGVAFFEGLDDSDLDQINHLIRERRYRKNMFVFYEGEPGEAIFFVKSGKVKVFKSTEDGREHILRILSAGEGFAEAILFEGGAYPANAETLEDTELLVLKRVDVEQLIVTTPNLAMKIIKLLAIRLRNAQKKVKDLALQDVTGRIAGYLLSQIEEKGGDCSEGVTIRLNLTRQELANMVGTTRETVSRVLNDFKSSGALRIEGKEIKIIDSNYLYRVANHN